MELMLLVYAVENLSYNGSFFYTIFQFVLWANIVLGIGVLFYAITEGDFKDAKSFLSEYYPKKTVIFLIISCLTLHTLLPQRQTAIYMVGAYAAQEVLTADKTKELGNKTYLAVSNQLDKWAEEVPELKTLISDQVEKVVKDKIVEEVK